MDVDEDSDDEEGHGDAPAAGEETSLREIKWASLPEGLVVMHKPI